MRKNNRKNMHLGAKPSTFKNADQLRRNPTPAEEKLWEYLRDRKMEGVKFRQQHPFKNYAADFYAHELKLVIEADGDAHLEPAQRFKDEDRAKVILENKLELQRFTNNAVLNSIDDVLSQIRRKVIEIRVRKEKKSKKRRGG